MKQQTIKEMESTVASKGKFLVDFYADWCSPCRAIAPVLNEIHSDENIDVIKINIDHEDKDMLLKFNIRSIPTLLAYKDGEMVERVSGMQSKDNLLKMFEAN